MRVAYFVLLGLGLLGFNLNSQAQNLKLDLENLNKKYSVDSFSATYKYTFFINNKKVQNDVIEIQRQGENYFAKTKDVIQISDGKHSIAIYETQNLIVVRDKVFQQNNPYEFDFKKLEEQFKSHRLERDSAEEKIYRFVYKDDNPYDELVISFNPKTFEINYVELIEIVEQDKAVLHLEIQKYDYVLNKSKFQSTGYVTINNAEITLDKKYKKYRLIDQRYKSKK